MSESENFLARWSRLKHEAALDSSGVGKLAPVEALQGVDEPPARPFDPASLPSIESIDAATDIRPFLEACVPDELTRAALRSTWSADPAIRDFVGIAESQWDFNDPATIPGFAAHAGADYVCSVAVRGVGTLSTAVGTPAESSPMVEPLASQGTCSDPAELAPQATPATTDHSHEADVGAPAGTTRTAELFTQARELEADLGPRMTHSHGGALPQ
jgi:hypothetical protein